jgi:hypothetical protein
MPWIGAQPRCEARAIRIAHIARMQQRQPFAALGFDLAFRFATHS